MLFEYRHLRVGIWLYPILAAGIVYSWTSEAVYGVLALAVVGLWARLTLLFFGKASPELGDLSSPAPEKHFPITG